MTSTDMLAHRIIEQMRGSGLAAGARLPTERDLAAAHQVSRSTIRSALAKLEADGLLSREVGRGTFLRRADLHRAAVDGDDHDVGPADVQAARLIIEPQAMALVVAKATKRDLEVCERSLHDGDRASGYEEFEAADVVLHRGLVAATHNPLLVSLYATIEAARHGMVWGAMKRRNDTAERREQYQRQHHAIVEAAWQRDADTAVAAMREHLLLVSANLLGLVL